jgi:hypothetical protein
VVQIARVSLMAGGEAGFWLLHGRHGVPDRGRSLTCEPRSIQSELIFVDTAEQFYISDRDSADLKFLKPSIGRVLDLTPR